MMLYWNSKCPLWMTARDRAYLEDRSEQQIRRVTNIGKEDFIQAVSKGEPIIVTDAVRGKLAWKGREGEVEGSLRIEAYLGDS